MENWKDIEGYEGIYQISNYGRVKSLKPRYKNKSILKARTNIYGYSMVYLSYNKRKEYRVHRLVAQAFIDNPENKPQVNHKDGNKKNNNVENLEWCTSSENNLHACKTGLMSGFKHHNSKFTKEEILWIRNNYKEVGCNNIARKFKVTPSTIGNIANKKTYKYI